MEFRFEQLVSASYETVFRFYENPAHLSVLHMGWPGFRLLHHEGHIHPGATTWIEQTMAGCIPLVLGFRHTIYEPPHRFGEELIHGPFSLFSHMHEFEPVGEKTLIRDRLAIQLSWQYGGESVTRHLAAPSIRSLFAFRNQALECLADSDELVRLTASTQLTGN